MNFWVSFWAIFFFASLAIFAILAVLVSIGGFFNIRALFKRLTTPPHEQKEVPAEKNDDQP